MRDPTRGGIAQVCIEIADMLGRDIHLEESNIPVKDWVRGLCGIAGLDHLYLPCEGNMIFLVREPAAVRLLDLLSEAGFKEASAIGKVGNEKNNPGGFVLTSSGGIRRLSGSDIAQIPRIC